jgi:hypothetical protein
MQGRSDSLHRPLVVLLAVDAAQRVAGLAERGALLHRMNDARQQVGRAARAAYSAQRAQQ